LGRTEVSDEKRGRTSERSEQEKVLGGPCFANEPVLLRAMGPLYRQLSNTKVECLEVSLVKFAVMGGKRVDIARAQAAGPVCFPSEHE
jgi:hypothetical protein